VGGHGIARLKECSLAELGFTAAQFNAAPVDSGQGFAWGGQSAAMPVPVAIGAILTAVTNVHLSNPAGRAKQICSVGLPPVNSGE
jgi:hypothetical protein